MMKVLVVVVPLMMEVLVEVVFLSLSGVVSRLPWVDVVQAVTASRVNAPGGEVYSCFAGSYLAPTSVLVSPFALCFSILVTGTN
jgi:hypothetical protein